MSATTIESIVRSAVLESIEAAIKQEKDRIVEEACREFEGRVRKIVGSVAISLSNIFSVEHSGQELVIRVKIGKGESS